MTKFLLVVSVLTAIFIVGCGSSDGPESNTEMVEKGNKSLPPDPGNGPGLVSPQRPTMPQKGGGSGQ